MERVTGGLLSLMLLVLPCALHGQTVTNTTAVPSKAVEDTIELSPFVVTDTGDVGYQAGNTLAATRLNQSLKDTASSISVFTSEFISDLGATDLTSALGYAVNVELQLDDDRSVVNGNQTINDYQNYRVRGLPASVSRNYFAWSLPSDTYNLERIEDSRGPNSVLFGIGSPGGVLNVSTKQAVPARSFYRGTLSFARFDSHRGTIDLNQAASNRKLALRLNAVYDRNNSFREYAFKETHAASLALKYVVSDKTQIRAEVERGQIDDNQPRTINLFNFLLPWDQAGRPTFATRAPNAALGITQLPPAANQPRVTYIDNNDLLVPMNGSMLTTGDGSVITDRRLSDYSINVGGPGQDRHSRFNARSIFIEHRFAKNTFLELAYNHQDYTFVRFDPRGSFNRFYGDPNQTLNGGQPNPFAGRLMLETNWIRTTTESNSDSGRAMFSTGFDWGKWGKYNFAAMGELDKVDTAGQVEGESWAGAPFNAIPENAQNAVWRRKYVTEREWNTYFVSGPQSSGLIRDRAEPITGRTLSSTWVTLNSANPNHTYDTQKTWMAAGQARYFSERLIIGAGVRRDTVNTYAMGRRRDPNSRAWVLAADADADTTALPTWSDNEGQNRTLGVVYHVLPKISVFYNEANNIGVPSRTSLIIPASGEPTPIKPPAPKGSGKDMGLAFDLLGGKIYARATYYETQSENQTTTFSPPTRQAKNRILDTLRAANAITQDEYDVRQLPGVVQGTFGQKSEGYELEVTANVTKTWRLRATWSRTTAIQENTAPEWVAWEKLNTAWLAQFDQNLVGATNGETIAQEIVNIQNAIREATDADGVNLYGNRRYKVNLFTRVDLPYGWLKGAYIGGGYKHQSKMFTGLDALRQPIYSNSYWRMDLLAGYKFRLRDRGVVNLQLNVDNVFNERDPLVTRYVDGTRTGVVAWVIQPPTLWRFTASFEF